jgi:hypothetical protein
MSGPRQAGSGAKKLAAAALVSMTVLAASLTLLCPDLSAKEKRGSRLEVTCRDGRRASRRIIGELIAVRADSLLLVQEYSEFDLSIDVADIIRVKVIRKSKAAKWGTYGAVIGFCGGVLRGYRLRDPLESDEMWQLASVYYGAIYAAGGLVAGALAGRLASDGDTFEFEGRSDTEIKVMLSRLRTLARVRDFR